MSRSLQYGDAGQCLWIIVESWLALLSKGFRSAVKTLLFISSSLSTAFLPRRSFKTICTSVSYEGKWWKPFRTLVLLIFSTCLVISTRRGYSLECLRIFSFVWWPLQAILMSLLSISRYSSNAILLFVPPCTCDHNVPFAEMKAGLRQVRSSVLNQSYTWFSQFCGTQEVHIWQISHSVPHHPYLLLHLDFCVTKSI